MPHEDRVKPIPMPLIMRHDGTSRNF